MPVDLVVEDASFARLGPAWRELSEETGLLGPFSGFTWQYEWWKSLGGGRRLRLLVAREGSRVDGILPLFEEDRDGARRLALVGSAGGGGDYLDAPCRTPQVRNELLSAAAELGADLLELDDVESHSPLLAEAVALAQARGCGPEVEPRYPCRLIPVNGTFEQYLSGVPRRENLRRRRRWLERQPGFRIACETAPEAVPAFLARFGRLHAARWSTRGGTQAFADPRLPAFHARVAPRLAEEGALRMWTLWVAREPVAVAYGIDDRDRSLYYQSGFLPAWGARSVGLVLFAAFVEDAFSRGLREVDLLRGAEAYKEEWAPQVRWTSSFRWALTRRGEASLAWRRARARVRRSLREALPAPVADTLTRLVREGRLRSTVMDAADAA